jgi:2-polyprenyl-6-methoxyphenol hydroxylase-like FAD-dependent oxidoreductase
MTLSHGENMPPISRVCYSILPSRVRKMLGFVQSTLKWRLMDRKPLEGWIHESGRVILLGDACHPMLVSYIVDLLLNLV